jgi:Ser/Thr protein kinase RdoA (MazF antagonist)
MNSKILSFAAEAAKQFGIYGEFLCVAPFGGGHINETCLSEWSQAGNIVRYTHQRINHTIFLHPDEIMENIQRVTNHIRGKLQAAGEKDWTRQALTVIPAKDGKLFVRDPDGGWWRTYLFIEKCHTQDITSSPQEARFLGKSIGNFQKQLADLGSPRLFDSIPDFHNMEKRYIRFNKAVTDNPKGRVKEVQAEIDFLKENEERGGILIRSIREGKIPERITHNDTKMNNILIDDETGNALCILDLDTVMPGTSLFDVGDLIRTVTTRAAEDEIDLSKVVFDLNYFEPLLAGYLSEALEFLNDEEKALLAESGRNLTHIMALRFLTDYIEGDVYYHIARPSHNIDRCRNQIALIKSMDAQWDKALQIAEKLCL